MARAVKYARMLKVLALSLIMLSSSGGMAAQDPSCNGGLTSEAGKKTYRFLAFNVENLFMRAGSWERTAGTVEMHRVNAGDRERQASKSPEDLKRLADLIRAQNPDFMILTEVEDHAADRFNREYLNGAYEVRCERGNDPRGIEIAILVRKSLGFEIEYRTNKDLTWNDPATGNARQPLFARDFPIAILRTKGSAKPTLILTGQHAKSKRDRPNDPESHIWRAAEYKAKAEIIAKLKLEFPGVTIVTGGDFNTEVRASAGQGSELGPIARIMKDAFDIAARAPKPADRITHSYFPREEPGRVHRQQMDTIMVDLAEGAAVLSAQVVQYRNASGALLGLPQSYSERSLQPSDHNPVSAEIALPQ